MTAARDARDLVRVAMATAANHVRRSYRYRIAIVQETLYPILLAPTMYFAYAAADRGSLGGTDLLDFLAVGMLAVVVWNGTVWSAGFALEHERAEGTLQALLGTKASRSAIVIGYGIGAVARLAPSLAALGTLAAVTGVRLPTGRLPLAVTAFAVLMAVCVCAGYAMSALFLFTRNAHNVATLLNFPIWVLSGALVPSSDLPGPLAALARCVPMSHALDALRAATSTRADLTDLLPSMLTAVALAVLCAAAGRLALRLAERHAQRTGLVDLY
ncbi:ABC transporter permease [Micromonospora sp. NPDC051141]|uniref:ABC transporter permease n=1 Tax=Micromonospora sp. NPDC051141 TaxID=3364284 RepID=UPI0037B0F2E4